MIGPLVGAFILEGSFSEGALREASRAVCLEYKGASYVRPSYKSPTLEGSPPEGALVEASRAICLEYKGASYVRPSYKSPYFRRVAS